MTPKAIADLLEEAIGVDGAPRRLIVAIEDLLYGRAGVSRLEASECAERIESAVLRIIAQRAAQSDLQGTMSALAIVGSTGNSVAGCSYALNSDSPTVAAAKQRRRHVASLLLAIKALSFNQFESFCARVLILMGAATAQITPHAGDQGIDFYGHLTLGQLNGMPAPFMRLMHDVKLAFVGQAKHYPAQNLGPNVVRELVGAVSLARSRTFSASDVSAFDDADLKPFSPCVILLFTTGGISRGARQLAESAGVIVRSGEQLAVFLADHGVAMTDVNGDQFFDPAAFAAWVSTELRPG